MKRFGWKDSFLLLFLLCVTPFVFCKSFLFIFICIRSQILVLIIVNLISDFVGIHCSCFNRSKVKDGVHKNKHTTTKHTCRVSLASTLHFFTSLSPGGGDKLTSHTMIQGVKCWKISTQTTTIIKVLLYIRVRATSSIP